MDLGAHARADLRRELLNAWTGASGDYAAVTLLPYYEGYRALVRAKVAALRGQQGARCGVTAASTTLAHQYLAWERRRCARRIRAGRDGRTVRLRQDLARDPPRHGVDAFHLRSDVERKRLAGLGPSTRRIRRLTAASTRRHSTSGPTPGCRNASSPAWRATNRCSSTRRTCAGTSARHSCGSLQGTVPRRRSCTARRRSTNARHAWRDGRVGHGRLGGDGRAAGSATRVLGPLSPAEQDVTHDGRYDRYGGRIRGIDALAATLQPRRG